MGAICWWSLLSPMARREAHPYGIRRGCLFVWDRSGVSSRPAWLASLCEARTAVGSHSTAGVRDAGGSGVLGPTEMEAHMCCCSVA